MVQLPDQLIEGTCENSLLYMTRWFTTDIPMSKDTL